MSHSPPLTTFFSLNEELQNANHHQIEAPIPNTSILASIPPPTRANSPDIFATMRRPVYPIRMSDRGPQPFSWEKQTKWVRWEQREDASPKSYWRDLPCKDLLASFVHIIINRLALDPVDISLEHLWTGGFNSTFVVSTTEKENGSSKEYVFRIPIPEHPFHKMECEIATMEYVRYYTSIPVPIVYAYDSSTENELGLEWMLMEKVMGENVFGNWMDLENEVQVQITRQVAAWQDELSRITCDRIGGLYIRWMPETIEFFIGSAPDGRFSMNRRLLYDVSLGPYSTLVESYDALLQLYLQEADDPVLQALHVAELARQGKVYKFHPSVLESVALAKAEIHEDDLENWLSHAWSPNTPQKAAAKCLKDALSLMLSPEFRGPMLTSLQHTDISGNNLLMDKMGNITALLDWESNGFWPVCAHLPDQYPPLLTGYFGYQDMYSFSGSVWYRNSPPTEQDWRVLRKDIEDIVLTRLRRVYRDELGVLQSPLLQLFDEEEDDDDFHATLRRHITYPFAYGVSKWLKSNGLYHGEDDEGVENEWDEEEGAGDIERTATVQDLTDVWGHAATWTAWETLESLEEALAKDGQVGEHTKLSDCSKATVVPVWTSLSVQGLGTAD
ncbi:hypothetical protein MMC18_008771 [Xylographa bjoerkii]|nr:hypothetical protein [Xylographa bjoerkii]